MKKLLFSLALCTALFACDDDEKIEIKDYGMKSFEADLQYSSTTDPESGYPMSTYAQQTYFAFGKDAAVATGTVDTDSWTQFNVFDEDAADYNATSDVDGWDLVFTRYYGTTYDNDGNAVAYNLVGALHNIEKNMAVAEMMYEESTEADAIAQAFANMTINDVESLSYNEDIQTIGSDWKQINSMYQYEVLTNKFYFVKLADGTYYKLRFLSFYGETKAERIIKVEYALMQ